MRKKNIVALGGSSLLIMAIVAMIVGASPRQVNVSESDIFTTETIKNEAKMSENSEEPTETFQQMPCVEYTAEDLDWLQKCVQAEQGDFSYRASYLTASCIINRALTRNMTITEVIFEPGAFAVVSNGRIYDAEPSGQTIGACFDALACPEEWCLAFSSGHSHDSWATPIEEIETPWGTVEVFYTYDH